MIFQLLILGTESVPQASSAFPLGREGHKALSLSVSIASSGPSKFLSANTGVHKWGDNKEDCSSKYFSPKMEHK